MKIKTEILLTALVSIASAKGKLNAKDALGFQKIAMKALNEFNGYPSTLAEVLKKADKI